MTKKFYVQGSAIIPYEITVDIENNDLHMNCTCPAGQHSKCCKHILKIINETPEIQEIINQNEKLLFLRNLSQKQEQLELLKKEISAEKRKLERILLK